MPTHTGKNDIFQNQVCFLNRCWCFHFSLLLFIFYSFIFGLYLCIMCNNQFLIITVIHFTHKYYYFCTYHFIRSSDFCIRLYITLFILIPHSAACTTLHKVTLNNIIWHYMLIHRYPQYLCSVMSATQSKTFVTPLITIGKRSCPALQPMLHN